MKIALVSPYDFAYPGGVVNHISALEHHFTKMGHQVKVVAPASKAVPDFGDRFIPIGKPRPIPASGSICRVTISLRLASRIKEVLAQEKFDITIIGAGANRLEIEVYLNKYQCTELDRHCAFRGG